MKNLFAHAFFALLIVSCAENNEPGKLSNGNEFLGLTRAQLDEASISVVLKYAPSDLQYLSVSDQLVKKASSTVFAHQQAAGQNYGDYYEIVSKKNMRLKALRTYTSEAVQKYIINAGNEQYLFLHVETKELKQNGSPRFTFSVLDMDGNVLSDSGSKNSARTNDWWGCVVREYNSICGGFWASIMCDAATIACPECFLTVIGAIMISCVQV